MAKGEVHRMVVEVDKDQYQELRGYLISKYGQTVSDWVRQKIADEINQRVKGQTKYGQSSRR